VIFPGCVGTMDEFFELMTLVQTGKLKKKVPIVVYGSDYWDDVLDFDAMVRHGVIDKADLDLIHRADSVDDAYQFITAEMTERFLDDPGGRL
jgi:predicted Rossmann-fold nucleotide-binding protein